MTWRRFIARNDLAAGTYNTPAGKWRVSCNVEPEHYTPAIADVRREYLVRSEHHAGLLLGDLRRLEADAVDEGSLCKWIAESTHVDVEVVAAVLQKFFAL